MYKISAHVPWEILWPCKYHCSLLLQCIIDFDTTRILSWCEIVINLKKSLSCSFDGTYFAKFKVLLTKYKFAAWMSIMQSWERTRKLFAHLLKNCLLTTEFIEESYFPLIGHKTCIQKSEWVINNIFYALKSFQM